MITITLQKIRYNPPCIKGWEKVFSAHKHLGMDTEFPLISVLTSNDLDDTIWCMRRLPEHNNLWRKYAVWCSRQIEHLMTDKRSKNALDVAWRHSNGLATDEELADARAYAANAASYFAGADMADRYASLSAYYAAETTAWDAAREAVMTAVMAAACASSDYSWKDEWKAAWSAARDAQQKKLTEILTAGKWVD